MQKLDLTYSIKENSSFVKLVAEESGQDIKKCYQCGKCSAGCPLSSFMDISPNQVIRMAQLGMKDELLQCEAIWICAYCSTCSVRCPRNIELAEIMDTLRITARREQVRPRGRAKNVAIFNNNFLGSLRRFGRLHEFATMFSFNIKSGKPFKDAETGMSMLTKGKLKLIISSPKGKDEISRIFTKAAELEEKRQ